MNNRVWAQSIALVFTSLILTAFLVANYPLLINGKNSSIEVQAQNPPPLPLLYTGNVTLNGSPAPDGLNVTAVDNGQVVGSALTSGGAYSLSACSPQNCNLGDTLSFKLNSQLIATETVTVDNANRGTAQTQNLAFTGTLTSAAATAAQMTTSQSQVTSVATQTTSVTTQVSSVSTPEFPTVVLTLLAALAVAFALVHKRNANQSLHKSS